MTACHAGGRESRRSRQLIQGVRRNSKPFFIFLKIKTPTLFHRIGLEGALNKVICNMSFPYAISNSPGPAKNYDHPV